MFLSKPELGHHRQAMWAAVGLAWLASLSYILISADLLAVGNLSAEEMPIPIVLTAATCYALGGLLVLLRRRWLWVVGALINAGVMLLFVSGYLHRPAVLFSPGGVLSKAAQLLLEVALLTLIAAGWRKRRLA